MSHGAVRIVPMNAATAAGTGASAGTVRIVETPYGLAFHPTLTGLPPGLHGFHVHEKPSCAPGEQDGALAPALGAGGHLDPPGTKKTRRALGRRPPRRPAGALRRCRRQRSTPVLAPRLKLADVADRSLMVHAGGDNHADHPRRSAAAARRIVCGVIRR